MPLQAGDEIAADLDRWARLGVEGWFEGESRWLDTAEELAARLAPIAGALADEVAVMGSLTTNLHLLLGSFYRPTTDRFRILVEEGAFPSDAYAVESQAAWHGLDPARSVGRIAPRAKEATLRTTDVVDLLEREGGSVALVLLPGVSYLTGEALDIEAVTEATQAAGALAVWDLAHAIGNIPLALHDWGVDAAVWCTYKYLNAGPGAPGATFVHERHGRDRKRPRLAGWWGTDPALRFRMDPSFEPQRGAGGFAVSTPSILALAPLRASLLLFERAGPAALRERSLRLTAYLEQLLGALEGSLPLRLLTPRAAQRRGCQLSIATPGAGALAAELAARHGVVCDFREPDILRLAPVPLYNTFHDCWRAAQALSSTVERGGSTEQ